MKETIYVKPELSEMAQIIIFVERILKKHHASTRSIFQIGIIADEIFSNIVHYSGANEAAVECDIADGVLTMCFYDNGRPYDPTGKEDPDITLPAAERKIGGLGIFMVKEMVQGMEYIYNQGYNILTIHKLL